MVLFLEEDHYVAEDFLHVLKLMERTSKHSCERCNVLSLGTYLKTYNYYADFSRKVSTVAQQLNQTSQLMLSSNYRNNFVWETHF